MENGTHLRGLPLAAIAGPALWAAAKLRVAAWDRLAASADRVRAVQLATLSSHCRTAAATEFGRAHELAAVRSHDDFKRRVPLRTYADFEPYLERMRKGARDVLWPGLIPYYGQSSGSSHTAALNKFLPISHEQIGWQQKAGFDVVCRYLALSGDLGFTRGYTMGLLPPGRIKMEGEVGVASNPGLMQTRLPWASRLLFLPKPPLRDIEDYDQKLDAVAGAYLDHDVRAMTGTTCWFSIFFDRVLKAARDRGRKVDTIAEIWPNLRVLFGGGVNAEPYRRIIDERMGRPTLLIDNYNATEGGIFAVTDDPASAALLMIPDRGVFFEFVPLAEHGRPDATRLALWEVETGVDYSVALTTSAGLFGYYIGDYIRFTSLWPHRMEFAGRTSGVLSVTQELMSALELERAFAAALAAHPSRALDFAASAEVGTGGTGKSRYVLFVEFERDPDSLDGFAAAFDRELCAQNRVYREHRSKDVAILAPRLVPLRPGATRGFMQALGQTSIQHKFPRILDERRRDLLRSFARQGGAASKHGHDTPAPENEK